MKFGCLRTHPEVSTRQAQSLAGCGRLLNDCVMNKNSLTASSLTAAALRRQAEGRLREQPSRPRAAGRGQQSAVETKQILHDLRVHQIELEIQNEELHRIQLELAALRDRYFNIYDLAPVGYFTLSDQGLILEANLTASTLLGAPKNQLVARRLAQFIFPADQDQFYLHYKELRTIGERQTWTLRLMKADGTGFWGELDATALTDEAGTRIYLVTLSDRTNRKQAEETLRVSEEQLRLFIAHAPAAVAMFDTQMRYVFASQRWVSDYGLEGQELRGRSHYEIFPEIPERWKAIYRRCLAGGIERTEEDSFVRANGSTQWIRWEVRPWFTTGEILGGIVILSEDITARRQAETALRESEFRWKFALEGAGDGLWDWDIPAGTVLYSPQWKAMLGYAEEEIGPGLAEWRTRVHPDDLAATLAAVQAHLDGTTPLYSSEYRRRCRDGSWKWILDRGLIVSRAAGGQPLRLIGTHVDIAVRKQSEELVQSFTQEIIRAREDERQQVAARLHHDVGSLAVGVSAYLAALAADLRAGKTKAGLSRVRQTQQLFNDAVTRLKGVAMQLRPPELDVTGLAATLREHCAQTAKQSGCRIQFTALPARRKPIASDLATIMFRVAQEALTNAIKHGGAQRIAVRLRVARPAVTLVVQDNGAGFDPAQQAARPLKQIGLRVMREMAASVGGLCTIQSARGQGTQVRVRLPLAAAVASTAAAARRLPRRSARAKSRTPRNA